MHINRLLFLLILLVHLFNFLEQLAQSPEVVGLRPLSFAFEVDIQFIAILQVMLLVLLVGS